MRRNFLTRTARSAWSRRCCRGPVVGLGLPPGPQTARAGFRRGIDLAGGTILVYEVDLDRTEARKQARRRTDGPDPDDRHLPGCRRTTSAGSAERPQAADRPGRPANVIVRPVGDHARSRSSCRSPGPAVAGARRGATEDFGRRSRTWSARSGCWSSASWPTRPTTPRRSRTPRTDSTRPTPTRPRRPGPDDRARAGLPPAAPRRRVQGSGRRWTASTATYAGSSWARRSGSRWHVNSDAGGRPDGRRHVAAARGDPRPRADRYQTSDDEQAGRSAACSTAATSPRPPPTKDERDPRRRSTRRSSTSSSPASRRRTA